MDISKVTAAWSEARRVHDALPYDINRGPDLQSLFILAYQAAAPRKPRATVERAQHVPMPPEFATAAVKLIHAEGSKGATAGEVIRAAGYVDDGIAACQIAGGWLRQLGYQACKSNGQLLFRKPRQLIP